MAATAESMIASLSGPAEGSEGNSSAAPSEAPVSPSTPSETQQPVTAAAPAVPKDTPQDIERKHLAALHQERGENKALRQQLTDLQQQIAALQKPASEPKPAEPEQEPDFLADPKGYVDKKVGAALAKLDANEKTTKETAEQVKQREQNEAVFRSTQAAEAQFFAQTPDYPQALQHIRGVRTQQLQQLFPEATGEQINNHIAFEERETARMLVTQGRNPAEFAYNFARTLGYQKAAAPAPEQKPAPIDKDAVRTLGSGGGSGAPADEVGNSMPEFAAARAEVAARFKKKR